MMRETVIEKYLADQVEGMGGLCMKFVSPGLSGVPDRLVLSHGVVCFCEIKAPGRKPRALQKYVHEMIRKQNIPVFVVDSYESADEVVSFLWGGGDVR